MTDTKNDSFQFLRGLEHSLRSLPAAAEMEAWIRSTTAKAKSVHAQRHLNTPEALSSPNRVATPAASRVRQHRAPKGSLT